MEWHQVFGLCIFVFLVGLCFGLWVSWETRRQEILRNTKDLVEKFMRNK